MDLNYLLATTTLTLNKNAICFIFTLLSFYLLSLYISNIVWYGHRFYSYTNKQFAVLLYN
ncbi:hypothetical protein BLOT_014378 [Blomia tropicalis]|nr:hypothetical protein BLOT_014378 [Blomia tropicalis]